MSARSVESQRRTVSVNFLSRLVVVAAGLPLVLGSAYVGGWFLFALGLAAALVALHEVYRLARPLRPLVLAGFGGAIGTLLGASSAARRR